MLAVYSLAETDIGSDVTLEDHPDTRSNREIPSDIVPDIETYKE